jgi:hypothetical protein
MQHHSFNMMAGRLLAVLHVPCGIDAQQAVGRVVVVIVRFHATP